MKHTYDAGYSAKVYLGIDALKNKDDFYEIDLDTLLNVNDYNLKYQYTGQHNANEGGEIFEFQVWGTKKDLLAYLEEYGFDDEWERINNLE